LTHTLARHLDQTELADRIRLRARAVATEVGAQLLHDLVAVRLRLHVDEVADDDAAQIAKSSLTSDLASRLEVRPQNRLLRILLAGIAAGIDVDGDERFGLLDDQVTARGQVAAALEEIAQLLLDVRMIEERNLLLIQLDAVGQLRRDALQILGD